MVAVIVDLLHELLSFSLEVPVQGEDGAVETLLQQAVHISGLVRLTAHPHVEQSQHDEDEEDDDSSQSHNDQQSYFIVGVELLRKKKCQRLSLKRNQNIIQGLSFIVITILFRFNKISMKYKHLCFLLSLGIHQWIQAMHIKNAPGTDRRSFGYIKTA